MVDNKLCLRIEGKAEKLVGMCSSTTDAAKQKLEADEAELKQASTRKIPITRAASWLILFPIVAVPVGWILNVSGCVMSAFAGAGAPPSIDLVGGCVAVGFVLAVLCLSYSIYINGKIERLELEINHDKEYIELDRQRLANAKALQNRANGLTGRLRIAENDERDSVVAQLNRIEAEIDNALS